MSNRPGMLETYPDMDLKLGIKSSLPKPKSTLALALLFWECSGRPATLEYSVKSDNEIIISDSLREKLISYTSKITNEEKIDNESFINVINQNQLFKSQFEALVVGFELVWRIAKIHFCDKNLNASAERTGKQRFPKYLAYTVNADILDALIRNDKDSYIRCLLAWVGFDITHNQETEEILLKVLLVFSENAIFKLKDGTDDIIFNQNSIYIKAINSETPVDINGDGEAKGPLRILKSSLNDEMNPYLSFSNNLVTIKNETLKDFISYQKRVATYLSLSANRLIKNDSSPTLESETDNYREPEDISNDIQRISGGENILLYGVPGSGKSWTIEHEYCNEDTKVERLVFHPDYTNSDFVGQILPVVSADKSVTYEFVPGPFTNILKKAYENPAQEYVLIIEEINRGNAPAIFGDIFQLLDRSVFDKFEERELFPAGTSEYGITNSSIAEAVYGDSSHKVRIPSNLSILGTMNTSDQNVFPLDTAFQRRWKMRLIDNSFDKVRNSLRTAPILDTKVTWQKFCEVINKIIVSNKSNIASAEDKRLGVYFIHENDLHFDDRATHCNEFSSLKEEYDTLIKKEVDEKINEEEKDRLQDIRQALLINRVFPEKVIKYLWDDAFKFNLETVFDVDNMDSLESVVDTFIFAEEKNRFKIFKQSVIDLLYS